ncbi:MAG: hypothetical protein ACU0CB_02160, partial [Roseovarius sp.]
QLGRQLREHPGAKLRLFPILVSWKIIGHNLLSAWMPDSLTNGDSNRRPVSHTLNRFQKCDTGKLLKTHGTQSQELRQTDKFALKSTKRVFPQRGRRERRR